MVYGFMVGGGLWLVVYGLGAGLGLGGPSRLPHAPPPPALTSGDRVRRRGQRMARARRFRQRPWRAREAPRTRRFVRRWLVRLGSLPCPPARGARVPRTPRAATMLDLSLLRARVVGGSGGSAHGARAAARYGQHACGAAAPDAATAARPSHTRSLP